MVFASYGMWRQISLVSACKIIQNDIQFVKLWVSKMKRWRLISLHNCTGQIKFCASTWSNTLFNPQPIKYGCKELLLFSNNSFHPNLMEKEGSYLCVKCLMPFILSAKGIIWRATKVSHRKLLPFVCWPWLDS